MDAFKPEYAIKLSSKNFGYEGNKKIVPLYVAFVFRVGKDRLRIRQSYRYILYN